MNTLRGVLWNCLEVVREWPVKGNESNARANDRKQRKQRKKRKKKGIEEGRTD